MNYNSFIVEASTVIGWSPAPCSKNLSKRLR
jgi:hypothetical protein